MAGSNTAFIRAEPYFLSLHFEWIRGYSAGYREAMSFYFYFVILDCAADFASG